MGAVHVQAEQVLDPVVGVCATSPAPPRPTRIAAGYVPLWPFIDQNEARAWQLAYRARGHQPLAPRRRTDRARVHPGPKLPPSAPIIDSTRGAAATILILGTFGGCALSSPDVYQRDRSVAQRCYIMPAILLGVAALAGALVALVGDAAAGVGVLYYATIALWFIATLRHIVSAPLPPPLTRDTHEVIDPHRTTRS
ncbi:hypothetical protein J5X84_42345 [Streptosporangiaceae bacterium NEAU-GS5]|nr:hypothetical protein [Streptosporangiaceae bacterium NEAU-GS5]